MNYIDFYQDPYFLFHHNKDYPPFSHHYGMHAHEIYELLYVISGSGTITIESTSYPLQNNSIYVIRANETHYIKLNNAEPYERIGLHFYPETISILDPQRKLLIPYEQHSLGEKNFYPLDCSQKLIVDNVFYNILQVSKENSYNKRLAIVIGLLCILTEINNIYTKNKHLHSEFQKHPVIGDVLLYINEHLFEKITTEDLCKHFFISRSHLCTLFKECTSSSIWNYILVKRMIAAKNMLQNGFSAKEVAKKCGYQDYSSFYRAYKKHFQEAPTK